MKLASKLNPQIRAYGQIREGIDRGRMAYIKSPPVTNSGMTVVRLNTKGLNKLQKTAMVRTMWNLIIREMNKLAESEQDYDY